MISVVIDGNGGEHALAITLAALVPAAAEGFVREVFVVGRGAGEGVRLVADAAGCVLVDGARLDAARRARSDWVLLLSPGVRLEADWFREAAAFIDRTRRSGAASRAATFRPAVDGFGLRARLTELWFRLAPPSGRSANVLAPRAGLTENRRLKVSRLRARAFFGGLTHA
jgi:hypothetical protein